MLNMPKQIWMVYGVAFRRDDCMNGVDVDIEVLHLIAVTFILF